MKFPSFIRLPRHKRFTIEPRYYDPIKEEIEERTEAIRREMQGSEEEYVPGKIKFERRNSAAPYTSYLQLLIAAVLGGLVVGWLFFGNDILYVGWLAVPVYLYFRLKKSRQQR